MDTRGDGVKLSYGDNVKVFGWAFKAASSGWANSNSFYVDSNNNDEMDANEVLLDDGDRIYVAGVEAGIGVVDAAVRYYKADNWRDNQIWEASVAGEIAKDLTLKGSYFFGDSDQSRIDGDDSGYLVGLSYRGAKASQPGSWGVYANYSDRPLATFLEPTLFAGGYGVFPSDMIDGDGYQGFDAGANVTLGKNIVAGVKYVDVESRECNTDDQTIWSELVFTF